MADEFKIQPKIIEPNFVPIGVDIPKEKSQEVGLGIDDTPALNNIDVAEPSSWDDIESVNKPEDQATNSHIYAQNDAPNNGKRGEHFKEGDLWFDTNDSNKIYRANNALQWVSVQDGSIFSGEWDDLGDTGGTKPDDNATDGAQAGDNLTDESDTVLYDDDIIRLLQYIYGDGSDGDVTFSNNATLTRDVYYNDLTINNGYTLNTGGYRVFVQGTFTNNGTIGRLGNDGDSSTDVNGAAGGAALSDGFLKGAVAGVAGGDGGNGPGENGDPGTTGNAGANYSLGTDGNDGGAGGAGRSGASSNGGGAGGVGGTDGDEADSVPREIVAATTMFDFASGALNKFTQGAGGGGGGGGGWLNSWGGGGGGSGSNGGISVILAKNLINNGIISVDGGDGGDGADANPGQDGGGGGGGAGGNGGILIIVYNFYTDNGTITGAGGTGGAKGAGDDEGDDGVIGEDGEVGALFAFKN